MDEELIITPTNTTISSRTRAEGQFMLAVAAIGIMANILSLIMTLAVRNLRESSNAFIIHHNLLDMVKSAFCIPFAKSILESHEPANCNILGGSYIVFVTITSFNLLAMVVNEAFHFSNTNVGVTIKSRYCVAFGIIMTWVASVIVNLGVAFIPGNPVFIEEIGHCTFQFGITRNYVLHILWMTLVTFALLLTTLCLRKLYKDIKRFSYFRFSTLIRQTFAFKPKNLGQEASQENERQRVRIKKIELLSLKSCYILILTTILFVVFWYPLFTLTLVDPKYRAPKYAYKILTMLAWCNSAVTPFIFALYNISLYKSLNKFKDDGNLGTPQTVTIGSSEDVRTEMFSDDDDDEHVYFDKDSVIYNRTYHSPQRKVNQNHYSPIPNRESPTRTQVLAMKHIEYAPDMLPERHRNIGNHVIGNHVMSASHVSEHLHMNSNRQCDCIPSQHIQYETAMLGELSPLVEDSTTELTDSIPSTSDKTVTTDSAITTDISVNMPEMQPFAIGGISYHTMDSPEELKHRERIPGISYNSLESPDGQSMNSTMPNPYRRTKDIIVNTSSVPRRKAEREKLVLWL